jgi:predicted dehydrogenase
MRLLIVGAGSIGSRHARNARALGIESIGLCDPHDERRAAAVAAVDARGFRALDEALDWQPEAAIVCTPPATHVPIAQACAEAGCHLLIEKPVAADSAGLDELASTAAAKQLGIAVAYQLRFHAALARLRELTRSGAIGRVLSIRAEYGQHLAAWRPTRDYRETYTAQAAQGGGILLDASHEIDYVRWIAGDPHSVYAWVGQLSDLEMDAEDTAAVILRLEGGRLAELHLDCIRRGYARGCTVIGSEATVQWDAATGLRITRADGTTFDERLVPDPNEPYAAELSSFLRARGAEAPMASLADARRVLDVVVAARRSSASGREIAL